MLTRSYKIEESLWRRVVEKAGAAGFSVSAIIRALLRMWIDGKIEIQV